MTILTVLFRIWNLNCAVTTMNVCARFYWATTVTEQQYHLIGIQHLHFGANYCLVCGKQIVRNNTTNWVFHVLFVFCSVISPWISNYLHVCNSFRKNAFAYTLTKNLIPLHWKFHSNRSIRRHFVLKTAVQWLI